MIPAGIVLRVARPTDNLERITVMYAEGLGFETLASFSGHGDFDGVILGHPGWPYPACRRPLARKVVSQPGRVDYLRVALGPDGVEPLAVSGASILSSTVRADGFVVVPRDAEGHAAGETVTVFLYDAPAADNALPGTRGGDS